MVLFLFVIMLLDSERGNSAARSKKFGLITGVISVGAIAGVFVNVIFGQA